MKKSAMAVLAVLLCSAVAVWAQSGPMTITLGSTQCSPGSPGSCSFYLAGGGAIFLRDFGSDSTQEVVGFHGIPGVTDGNYTVGKSFTFADGSSAVGKVYQITPSHPATLVLNGPNVDVDGDNNTDPVTGSVYFTSHSCGRYFCTAFAQSGSVTINFAD
jgi:hypothetical protein